MAKRSEFTEAEASIEATVAAVHKCSCGRKATRELADDSHGGSHFVCEEHYEYVSECVCSPARSRFLVK